MKYIKYILSVFLLLVFTAAHAQEIVQNRIKTPSTDSTRQFVADRPRVGIVLGGGGAKGAAHIGVLKYIEELGIPVDFVAGTSMGSIIGGLYSLGYSPDELATLIADMDWSMYMSNTVNRQFLSTSSRQHTDTYLLSVPFNTKTFKRGAGKAFMSSLPSGVINGTSLINLFNNLSVGYQDSIDFCRLPIPFACVATDILTGEAVVINKGHFPMAIRASMAIPGVFSPVYMNGHVLVDGGLVNNFPVDVCRQMGATIIIGIEVASELAASPEDLQSLPQLISQYTSIAVNADRKMHREMCDVYMHPDISGYGMLSFNTEAIDTLVDRGYQQARLHHDELMAIKAQIEAFGGITEKSLHAPKAKQLGNDTIVLASVKYRGVSEEDRRWLEVKGGLAPGDAVTKADIERAVSILTGTGAYTNITYNVEQTAEDYWVNHDVYTEALGRDSYNLALRLESAEPHDFSMGVRYDSEESAAMMIHLGMNQHRLAGLKFLFDARLNYNPRFDIKTSYCSRGLFDINLAYMYHKSRFGLGQNYSREYTNMTVGHHNISLFLSEFYTRRSTVSLGIEEDVCVLDADLSLDNIFYNDLHEIFGSPGHLGFFIRTGFEDFDDGYFPTNGGAASLDAHWRLSNRGIYESWTNHKEYHGFVDIRVNYQKAISLTDNLCILPMTFNRLVLGEHKELYDNMVGGVITGRYMDQQIPFIGFNRPITTGNFTNVLRLDLRYNISGNHYISLIGNYLLTANRLGSYFNTDKGYRDCMGFGLRYAYKMPIIGPISLDLNWSTITRRVGVYFNFGFVF